MLPTNVNRLAWQTFSEDVSTVNSDSKMTVSGLLDQVSVTRDASDYLWYTTSAVPALDYDHIGQFIFCGDAQVRM
ncbi:beta-galactosidase 3-like protein [Tanacetum coccineum]